MSRLPQRSAAAAIFAFAFGLACKDARALPLTADIAVTADDSGGFSMDADFSVSPSEHFTLNAGAGYSSSSTETADLHGTLLNLAASLHGERAGVALGYDLFDDATNYRAATLGARAWMRLGDFEFALLGRHRAMNVVLTLELPLRTARRAVDFSAVGGGLQLGFTRGDFTVYALAVEYDYDDDFTRFLDLAASPTLSRRPRIEALLGSFLTQAQGTIDRQAGVGIERGFGRHSFALDFSSVHDAILDTSSVSVVVTYRQARSAHFDWSVTAGMIDSDTYGGIGFASFGVGLAN
ncbi:MAG: hypothetical protein ABI769_15150 [Pseudomonadota bacterium]